MRIKQLTIDTFPNLRTIYNKQYNMKNYTEYKRQTREMPQATKDKISAKLKGRKLSDETKRRISDGQRKAWAQIPKRQEFNDLWPTNNNENKQNDGTETEGKF